MDALNILQKFEHHSYKTVSSIYLAIIYLFKANNRNTRKRCEICSKLTIKTPEQRQRRCSGVFIVNFERILHLFLVFLLLTLNKCISTEAHSESSRISKMKLFVKIVIGGKPLLIWQRKTPS